MPSKRPHTKTRHGCATCRRRRVRCDLQRPVCGNCIKRKIDCAFVTECPSPGELAAASRELSGLPPVSYGSPGEGSVNSAISVSTNTSAHNPLYQSSMSATPSPTSNPPLGSFSGLSKNVELMHYWTTNTCFTMTNRPERQSVWQVVVPKIAFQHDFLLHGILALSALHQCYDLPIGSIHGPYLLDVSQRHKQQALESYIPLLQASTDENCQALYAFSVVLGALSFAMAPYEIGDPCSAASSSHHHNLHQHHGHPVAPSFSSIDALISIAHVLSGSVAIASQHHATLQQSPLAPLLAAVDIHTGCGIGFEHMPPGMRDSIFHLRDAAASASPTLSASPVSAGPMSSFASSNREVCLSALLRLGQLYPPGAAPFASLEAIGMWPVYGGREFSDLLARQDSLAMVVAAHYGAIVHANRDVWFLDGLGGRLAGDVVDIVARRGDAIAERHLYWVRQVLGTGMIPRIPVGV